MGDETQAAADAAGVHLRPVNDALTGRGPTTGRLDDTLVGHLLDRSHTTAPRDVALLAAEVLVAAGARDVVFYMQDYDQNTLHPVEVVGHPAATAESVDGSLPGQAFTRHAAVERTERDGATRVWLPLLDGSDRVGVMALTVAQVDDDLRGRLRRLAANIAHLFFSKGMYTDEYFRVRRSRELRLAAEMQWDLLPPLTITTPQVSIAGLLEPAYEVGGDSFDYALNDEGLHFTIVDAMGHGLPSAIMATTAISAYRHARRSRVPLEEMYAQIDAVMASQFGADAFATAHLALLDTDTGRFAWVNAGHPAPLLLRGRHARALGGEPTLPVGFGGAAPVVATEQLERGDRLLFFTDGVTEHRIAGEMFGEERLAAEVLRHVSDELPAAEVVRRLNRDLLQAAGDAPTDDATLVLVHWTGPQ